MKTFIASLLALLAVTPQRTLDEFFNDFTARWVRNNPNLAVSSRYTGDERDRLEQQLAPETMEYKKSLIMTSTGSETTPIGDLNGGAASVDGQCCAVNETGTIRR